MGRGRPGRLPGGGGRQRREACEPPGPPGSTASPWSGAISRAVPGRQSGKEPEGGECASPPLAGRLLWDLLDFRDAVSPPRGRAHSGGSWLPAASTLRAGELGAEGGPTSGVPDGLACRMQTLRAAEKARGVCVCEAPGLSGAPPNGSCCWAVPGLSRLQPLPLELPPQGASQGPGLGWPALPHDLRPGRLCVWDPLLLQPCCQGPGARFLPRSCLAVPCTLVPQASRGARQALLPEPEVPTAPSAPHLSPHHP